MRRIRRGRIEHRRHELASNLIWALHKRVTLSDTTYYALRDLFAGNKGYRPLRVQYPELFPSEIEVQRPLGSRGGVPPQTEIDPR